ncbi:hypothetical protein K1719_032143 [Acacia pycnantha]|nr:hypothetical protein K1719_032143 [Acacia pycnantha]
MEPEPPSELCPPATDVVDVVHRRKRRIGQGDCEFTGKVSNPPRFEDWMRSDEHKEEGSRLKSYEDSLLAKSKWRDNWFTPSEEDRSIATKSMDGSNVGVGFEEVLDYHSGILVDLANPMCPKFLIDDKERERLCKQFAKSLFVKLLGASSVGKVLKLDVHTASRRRKKFARVCIELDLTKPLVPHYMVNGILKHVEYKSLQALCLNCGLFEHFKEKCVHGKKDHNVGEKVVLKGSKEMEEGEFA